MVEIVEKRGRGERPWRIRYRDNPDDPISSIAGFASKADALEWLKEHPVVEVDDEDQE